MIPLYVIYIYNILTKEMTGRLAYFEQYINPIYIMILVFVHLAISLSAHSSNVNTIKIIPIVNTTISNVTKNNIIFRDIIISNITRHNSTNNTINNTIDTKSYDSTYYYKYSKHDIISQNIWFAFFLCSVLFVVGSTIIDLIHRSIILSKINKNVYWFKWIATLHMFNSFCAFCYKMVIFSLVCVYGAIASECSVNIYTDFCDDRTIFWVVMIYLIFWIIQHIHCIIGSFYDCWIVLDNQLTYWSTPKFWVRRLMRSKPKAEDEKRTDDKECTTLVDLINESYYDLFVKNTDAKTKNNMHKGDIESQYILTMHISRKKHSHHVFRASAISKTYGLICGFVMLAYHICRPHEVSNNIKTSIIAWYIMILSQDILNCIVVVILYYRGALMQMTNIETQIDLKILDMVHSHMMMIAYVLYLINISNDIADPLSNFRISKSILIIGTIIFSLSMIGTKIVFLINKSVDQINKIKYS